MKTTKEQLELDYLVEKYNYLDNKIFILGDQFGPTDEAVEKLKEELRKIDALILDLMVKTQENNVKRAIIE